MLYQENCFSCDSSLGQHSNYDELQKAFQSPSVRHSGFIRDVGGLSNDLHATFLRMFHNLDTLVNPPIQCKQIERYTLAAQENLSFSTAELTEITNPTTIPLSSYVPDEGLHNQPEIRE